MTSVKKKMKISNKLLLVVLIVPVLLVLIMVLSLRIAFERSPQKDGEIADFGPRVSRVYDYNNFREIKIIGPWNIEIVQGNDFRVEVNAQENMLNLADISKSGEVLTLGYLSTFRGLSTAEPLTAVVVLPAVSDIDIAGTCRVGLRGFRMDWLRIGAKGEITMSATDTQIKNLELRGEGITTIGFSQTQVVNAKLNYNGIYTIMLSMNGGRLSGVMGGIGTVAYIGDADISEMKKTSAFVRIVSR